MTDIRREREKEEMREEILLAATEIIKSEGFEKLSIRKIAKKIDYSPSIIYHYFKDKDDILNCYMQRGYKKIVSAVASVETKNLPPKERLKEMTKNYIEAALNMPDEFMAAQLNDSPRALMYTGTLFKGASKTKPALAGLVACLKEIYKEALIEDDMIEITAQAITVSTLGLIMKLIIEKDIKKEQKNRLITFYIDDVVFRIAGI